MRKADYYPPHVRKDCSGCTTFQGEDHENENRKKAHQAEQKAWLIQQMEEKKQFIAMKKQQDMLYDKQRLAVNEAVNRNQHEFNMRNIAVACE